jgi:hypothetical protein
MRLMGQFGSRLVKTPMQWAYLTAQASIASNPPTFVPVDVAEGFVLLCNYTGKEVV